MPQQDLPFLSYGKQEITEDDIAEVVTTLKSPFLTQGPKVQEFEASICAITGASYALAVANGTAALHLAALAAGISSKDEVITSPLSFVATANCIAYVGGTPVFADILPNTYNLDPQDFLRRITPKTRAVIPVDFAGQPADMETIFSYASERGITIIEDAAHALGSRYADGSPVGSCKYSAMTIFSFHPVKTITTGEGGAITTNDKALYDKLLLLRTHGITKNPALLSKNPGSWYYEMQDLGYNCRLCDIQAALGVSQIKRLPSFIKRRREIVAYYNKSFKDIPYLTIPYDLYILLIDFKQLNKTRKQVMEELELQGIGTQVHYIPIHLQPYYKRTYGYQEGDYPHAEAYYEKALSIPLYPGLKDEDIERVVSAIKELGN
jgi:UDP-4-amino-4,6-dideoxy-N-acetyl-beta-L-altrosamine transaminase